MARGGDNIRALRNGKGLTLSEFAKAINYSGHAQVSKWEQGEAFPGTDALVGMQAVFGVSLDWLTGVEGAPERAPTTVALKGGKTISGAALEEALRIRVRAAVNRRANETDKAAEFVRAVLLTNDEAFFLPDPVLAEWLTDNAVTRAVGDAERSATRLWSWDAASRAARDVEKEYGPESGPVAALAGRLAATDILFATEPEMAPPEWQMKRKAAWAAYRQVAKGPG